MPKEKKSSKKSGAKRIRPVGNNIVIRPVKQEEEVSFGGIVIVGTLRPTAHGVVVEVSDEFEYCGVQPKDLIIYSISPTPISFRVDDEELEIIPADSVLAVI